MQTTFSTTTQEILLGTVRTRLTYRSRDAMEKTWPKVFTNEFLPEDHEMVARGKVEKYLEWLAQPQKGRSTIIIAAAAEMLAELRGTNVEMEVAPMVPELLPKPEPQPPVTKNLGKHQQMTWGKFLRSLDELDFAFLFVLGVADYGLVYIMQEMGGFWAIIYTLISVHVLRMTKHSHAQNTARTGISAVWVLEIVSFFIHCSMFNKKAWNAAMNGNLPFDPIEYPSYPFYIAVVLAALFSAAGVYAVTTKRALTVESVEAENYETQHQIKY